MFRLSQALYSAQKVHLPRGVSGNVASWYLKYLRMKSITLSSPVADQYCCRTFRTTILGHQSCELFL